MKSKLIAFFVVLILSSLVYFYFKNRTVKNKTVRPAESYTNATIKVAQKEINVEIADTEPKRERGLSGRSSLGDSEGMLFVYEQQNVFAVYWMKDMLIPIDIIWIDDGKVASVSENLPPPEPNTPDDKLTKYPSLVSVDYVLEVNSGFVKRNNIKVGDPVDLSNLKK